MGPAAKPISVLLADFQFLTRAGISSLIRNTEGFSLAGQLDSPSQLYETANRYPADLLIIDFREEDQDFDIVSHIMSNSDMQVLVITNYLGEVALQQLLALGIKAIVTKNCSEKEIVLAMQAACEGKRFFCNRVLDWMVDQQMDDGNNCDPAALTPRENEVLSLVAKGISTVEIAGRLHLSIHTVNTHRKNILRKLKLKSPAELIVFAISNGLTKGS